MPSSIIQTVDGGYALAGYTESFGAGHEDFWLVKVNHVGEVFWSVTFGGEHGDECRSLIQLENNGFALAGNSGSFGEGGG